MQDRFVTLIGLRRWSSRSSRGSASLLKRNGLFKELYRDNGRPRHESLAQRLFFAVAYCYCEANDLDLSPEADSGNRTDRFQDLKGIRRKSSRRGESLKSNGNHGSRGYNERILEAYKKAEHTLPSLLSCSRCWPSWQEVRCANGGPQRRKRGWRSCLRREVHEMAQPSLHLAIAECSSRPPSAPFLYLPPHPCTTSTNARIYPIAYAFPCNAPNPSPIAGVWSTM